MMRTLPGTGAMTLFRLVWPFVGRPSRGIPFRPAPDDLDLFATLPATRTGAALGQILYVGPLSPESGAADLLVALASWAEQHPTRPIEITWAGTGDLAGVFEAQPLPPTLTQRFAGALDRAALLTAFAGASLMAVPLCDSGAPVLEALTAGLVLIGGRRAAAMRPITGPSGPAWSYDERRRQDLAVTLSAALNEAPEALDIRRRAGRLLAYGARASERLAQPADHNRLVSGEVAL